MRTYLPLFLLCAALLAPTIAQDCVTTSFPSNNDNPSASTDFVTLTSMSGGIFSDVTAISCKTSATTADAFAFVKFNTNYETTSAKVANVCYL